MDREATSLRAERRALSARVAELEQQLAMAEADTKRLADQVAELQARARAVPPVERQTNERWVTDVTENAAVTLRSAQEAAQRTVRRAKERATEIEQTALQEAAELRKRAEAQAEKLLLVAQYDAEGLLQGAQASAEEILVRARQRSERVLTALEERRASVEAEIQSLEGGRTRLLRQFEKIRASADQALRSLTTAPSPRPRPPASSPDRSGPSGGPGSMGDRLRRAVAATLAPRRPA